MAFVDGCLCGACRYEIDRKYLNAIHCYCGMCRKAHGTAFSTHVALRRDQFRWLEGEPQVVPYESSPASFREFCSQCGTHLLVHGQTGDDTLAVPVGTLDGNPPVTILGYMYTSERVSWFEIADDLPQHELWPPGIGPDSRDEPRSAPSS